MKAICKDRIYSTIGNKLLVVEAGEIIDYTVNSMKFIINGVGLTPASFFNHFKVINGNEKLNYSDFEYILCNYVFPEAVLFPSEYSGIHHLIIQGWGGNTIMITVNKNENAIRVSFDDVQEKYTNYEDALSGIKNHK